MLRAAPPSGHQRRVEVFGTLDDGYVAEMVEEQLWQCRLHITPGSRKVGKFQTEVGAGQEIDVPARLLMRPTAKSDGTPTLAIAGVALGDPRIYNDNLDMDELISGKVDIVPEKRWDAKEAFGGLRVDQVVTSWEFAQPDQMGLICMID